MNNSYLKNMMSGKCSSQCWRGIVVRVFISALFIYAGYSKLADIAGTAEYIGAIMAWPAPVFFAWVIGLIEFVGGILLAAGCFKKWAAWALVILIVIATYYSRLEGIVAGDVTQLFGVLKSLAIIGGLMMMAGCGRCDSLASCGNCHGKNCGNCESGKCGICKKK
ncbi:MAG: DoxX family protein [Patescibacteria group bacterium]